MVELVEYGRSFRIRTVIPDKYRRDRFYGRHQTDARCLIDPFFVNPFLSYQAYVADRIRVSQTIPIPPWFNTDLAKLERRMLANFTIEEKKDMSPSNAFRSLDRNKSIKTRRGYEVRIWVWDARDTEFPIRGEIFHEDRKRWVSQRWTTNGRISMRRDHGNDLVNIQNVWLNVYNDGACAHGNFKDANEMGTPEKIIARMRIEIEPGRFDREE